MPINITDEFHAATTKGKIASAKEVFLTGDTENLQQIGEKTHQLEDSIKNIAATGGASTAAAVTFDNAASGMTAVTAQAAIDELSSKISEERTRVDGELEKKFAKADIVQEPGNSEEFVMSQKAVSDKLNGLSTEIIYDVSAHNDGAVFESLQALLNSSNLNTLIPTLVRCGGMSIRFIQGSVPNSDNKYVQYFLTKNQWSANEADWKKMNLEEEVSQLGREIGYRKYHKSNAIGWVNYEVVKLKAGDTIDIDINISTEASRIYLCLGTTASSDDLRSKGIPAGTTFESLHYVATADTTAYINTFGNISSVDISARWTGDTLFGWVSPLYYRGPLGIITFSEDGSLELNGTNLVFYKCYINRGAYLNERYLYNGTLDLSGISNNGTRKIIYNTNTSFVSIVLPNIAVADNEIPVGFARNENGILKVYVPGVGYFDNAKPNMVKEFAGRMDDLGEVTTSIALDGYYIHTDTCEVKTNTNYAVTNSIEMNAGDILQVTAYVTPDLAAISEYISTGVYLELVSGVERSIQSFSYVATRHCFVAVSYRKADGVSIRKYHSYRYSEFNKFAEKRRERCRILNGKVMNVCYSNLTGYPQNSVPHFLYAIEKGFNSLKADMRLTSDGKIVLNHDAGVTLDENGRITSYSTGSSTAIHNMTYDQYMELYYAQQIDGDYVSTCDLDTFLYLCKRKGIIPYLTFRNEYIDDTLAALIPALKKYAFLDGAIINLYLYSPSVDLVEKLRAAAPELLLCYTIDYVISDTYLYYAMQLDSDIICLQRSTNTPLNQTLRAKANDFGLYVWLWGVNTSDDYEAAMKEGATGFQVYSYDAID